MSTFEASKFMQKYNIDGVIVTNTNKIIISKTLLSKFKLHENYDVLCF